MAKTLEEITKIMKGIRFKKKFLGGVDEEDVWRIMGKLQKEYEELCTVEQAKSDALLQERDQMIARLRRKIKQNEKEE